MTTNVQVISQALRLIGVIGETQNASAAQGAACLIRLNQMLEAWQAGDIDLGWFPQTDPSTTIPIPAWAEQGVVSKHALDLMNIYPTAKAPPYLYDDSVNGYGVILRTYVNQKIQPLDASHLGGQPHGFVDITR